MPLSVVRQDESSRSTGDRHHHMSSSFLAVLLAPKQWTTPPLSLRTSFFSFSQLIPKSTPAATSFLTLLISDLLVLVAVFIPVLPLSHSSLPLLLLLLLLHPEKIPKCQLSFFLSSFVGSCRCFFADWLLMGRDEEEQEHAAAKKTSRE